MDGLNHYERRFGTPAERRARAEERRAELYEAYCERQRRNGFEPAPYERFGRDGGIRSTGLTNNQRRRWGLPADIPRPVAHY